MRLWARCPKAAKARWAHTTGLGSSFRRPQGRLKGYLKNSAKNKSIKKHIEDLRNALYKRDLTVSAEEEAPACGIVWMLSHAYFTQLPAIAFHDTSIIRLHESDSCYLMEKPEISLYFTKTNRHSWQHDLVAFIETLMQYIYAAETLHNKAV